MDDSTHVFTVGCNNWQPNSLPKLTIPIKFRVFPLTIVTPPPESPEQVDRPPAPLKQKLLLKINVPNVLAHSTVKKSQLNIELLYQMPGLPFVIIGASINLGTGDMSPPSLVSPLKIHSLLLTLKSYQNLIPSSNSSSSSS
jgi:hypothetical protein